MGLATAIEQLQEEVDSYNPGSSSAPPVKSTEWFLLRAAVLGLSYLNRLQTLDLESDPGASERVYKSINVVLKTAQAIPDDTVAADVAVTMVDPGGQAPPVVVSGGTSAP